MERGAGDDVDRGIADLIDGGGAYQGADAVAATGERGEEGYAEVSRSAGDEDHCEGYGTDAAIGCWYYVSLTKRRAEMLMSPHWLTGIGVPGSSPFTSAHWPERNSSAMGWTVPWRP